MEFDFLLVNLTFIFWRLNEGKYGRLVINVRNFFKVFSEDFSMKFVRKFVIWRLYLFIVLGILIVLRILFIERLFFWNINSFLKREGYFFILFKNLRYLSFFFNWLSDVFVLLIVLWNNMVWMYEVLLLFY